MVKNARRGGQNDNSKPTRRKQQVDPRFNLGDLNIESRRDDTSLVEATIELDYDLASTVVINDLKFTNVAMSLHDTQEFYNDLGRRPDENLTLSTALSIDDVVEAIVEDGNADHFE